MDSSDGVRLPDPKARGFADPNGCLRTQTMCSVGPPANLHAVVPAESSDRWMQISQGNSRSIQNADLCTTSLSSCSRFDFTFGPESVQNQPCSSQRIQLNGMVPQTSMNGICHPDFLHYRSNIFSKIDENAIKGGNASFPFFPITPERDNKSTAGRINEGAWQNVLTSMRKGSEHICLDQGVLRPVNAACAEISLQHMNQQKVQLANIEGANSTYVDLSLQPGNQEKRQVINLDGVDFSNKVSCQLSPVTPGHCKNKQDTAVAENICLGNANEDQEGRQQNDNRQTDKEHVQECVSDRAPDHFPCSDTYQQHNSVQGLATPLPKPKNKKHRPKVIKEGKSARKPRQKTPVQGTGFDKPAQRKRSARKKESGSQEIPSDERNNTGRPGKISRKSAKRSLNFDSEAQAKDKIIVTSSSAQFEVEFHGDTSNNSSSNAKSTLETSEGKVFRSSIEITTDMCRSGGQVSYEHNNLQQNPIPSVYASRRGIIRENIKALARESNGLETKSSCDSKVSSGVLASDSHTPQGGNQKGVKRDLTWRAGDAELFHVNLIPGNFCSQMYNKVNENHSNTANEHCFIPEACKKRRTENRHNKFAPTAPTTPLAKGGKSLKELREQVSCFADTQLLMAREKLRASGHMLRFGQTERLPVHTSPVQNINFKFNSTATTMVNSHFPSAPQTPQSGEQRQGPRGMEALIETENVKVPRKRRTKDRKNSKPNEIRNSSVSSEATMQLSNAIDFIVQKLKQLNLDGITQGFAPENLQNNAVVLYNRGGAMVPYESLFTALKKRRPRAKVDLDSETNRVWMLLMGKDCGTCPEGTETDKEKWWGEERKVFQGRADSFIARMHLIQGDRRFSKWKGSVVDSVVGVFLTQNVSDHLSSSAFMSLVSRYPNHFGVDRSEADLTNTSTSTESQPEYLQCSHPIKQKGGELEQQEISEDSLACHEVIDVEQDGNNTFGCTNGTASHGHGVDPGMVTEGTKPIDAEDMRLMESTFSSQNSVISSQNSSESLVQVSEQTGLSSDSFSEVEDAKQGNGWDNFKILTSFTELLQMAGTYRLHDYNTLGSGKMPQSGYSGSVIRHSERESTENEFQKCNDMGCLEVKYVDTPYSSSCLSHKQHGAVGVSDVPLVLTNLDKNSQNGFEMADKIESVLESHSLSTTSKGKSIAEIKNPCTTDEPSQKNTTGYTDQLNSGSMCSCSFTSDHPQLVPSPKVDTFRQSNSCNYSYIQWDASTTSRKEQVQASSGRDAEHDNHHKKDSGTQVMGKQNENERSTLNLNHEVQESHANSPNGPTVSDVTEFSSTGQKERLPQSAAELSLNDEKAHPVTVHDATTTPKKKKTEKKPKESFEWDTLRKEVLRSKEKKERTVETMDSIDWEAVRHAGASAISDTIRERGMNNVLAGRIKDFLDRLVNDHGSIDLEWLRDVPPDQVKDYLLSIRGLGLKSVECVRLLTLHHLAFPVDTNVGRICVRLGWVPLQPLPESVQLHLLELYPMLETIQKYLWPRLCELDQRTLYELHYQMITFGKVFCTKSKPNCNACPMRGECKHFASAYASARLALPGPEEKGLVTSNISAAGGHNREPSLSQMPLPQLEGCLEKGPKTSNISAAGEHNHQRSLPMMSLPQLEGCLEPQAPIVKSCEPLIEEPSTPEPEPVETSENAIEDAFYEDPDEIPVIKLNIEQFTQNLQNILQANNDLQEGDMSKALVALKPETASIPQPKLKNISRLRTEHQVYELPDAHPLLEGLEEREPDDPCPYLLAIWTPGETAQSMESPETSCNSQGAGKLCDSMTCFACNSIREARAQKVRGTLLIPCRTAMRGSFPLNGTYFQVNEVFADHSSSISPIDVPREWLWNLPRRTVYFGTSVPTIFRGLTTEGIQHCFWRGFVCVRGFDQRTRAPRPLLARLHFPASKLPKNKNATTKEAK